MLKFTESGIGSRVRTFEVGNVPNQFHRAPVWCLIAVYGVAFAVSMILIGIISLTHVLYSSRFLLPMRRFTMAIHLQWLLLQMRYEGVTGCTLDLRSYTSTEPS